MTEKDRKRIIKRMTQPCGYFKSYKGIFEPTCGCLPCKLYYQAKRKEQEHNDRPTDTEVNI